VQGLPCGINTLYQQSLPQNPVRFGTDPKANGEQPGAFPASAPLGYGPQAFAHRAMPFLPKTEPFPALFTLSALFKSPASHSGASPEH
jgi:hypothetical protein